jgi:D-methionine transport system ATP-binding protein
MGGAFIAIENLRKIFHSQNKAFEVLKGIDLSIEKGDIFGIVGFSGAGKSTLIRCLNRLETPDEGRIRIGDKEITSLNEKELNEYRQKIGIIFQQFNLFDSKTVFENVAFPLKVVGKTKDQIDLKVNELLEVVGLADKGSFYPGQLSGGQKQRVGIARALANDPDILLSDESTSALDPLTTLSVLDLLKDINKKMGLTIIIITHELNVIRYTCNHMAVLEDGCIAEKGSVKSVFANPQSKTAKLFVRINEGFSNSQWCEGGGI